MSAPKIEEILQKYEYKHAYGPSLKQQKKKEFEQFVTTYNKKSKKHKEIAEKSIIRSMKRERLTMRENREQNEKMIEKSLEKKKMHETYIKAYKTRNNERDNKYLNTEYDKKQAEPNNTTHQNNLLKLSQLLDEDYEPFYKNPKEQKNILKDLDKSNIKNIFPNKINSNTKILSNNNVEKDGFPDIHNISEIPHFNNKQVNNNNNDDSKISKLSKKERKNSSSTANNDQNKLPLLYEINRKENLLQNELKLLNREKNSIIKAVEKKNHIKMALVKSKDLLTKDFQNIYSDPLKIGLSIYYYKKNFSKFFIEVINEEDIENSLDNIDYILKKKTNNNNNTNTNNLKASKGPNLYVFPHVSISPPHDLSRFSNISAKKTLQYFEIANENGNFEKSFSKIEKNEKNEGSNFLTSQHKQDLTNLKKQTRKDDSINISKLELSKNDMLLKNLDSLTRIEEENERMRRNNNDIENNAEGAKINSELNNNNDKDNILKIKNRKNDLDKKETENNKTPFNNSRNAANNNNESYLKNIDNKLNNLNLLNEIIDQEPLAIKTELRFIGISKNRGKNYSAEPFETRYDSLRNYKKAMQIKIKSEEEKMKDLINRKKNKNKKGDVTEKEFLEDNQEGNIKINNLEKFKNILLS